MQPNNPSSLPYLGRHEDQGGPPAPSAVPRAIFQGRAPVHRAIFY